MCWRHVLSKSLSPISELGRRRYKARINKVTQVYCILLVYLHEATEPKTYHHWQHESKSQELDLDGQSIEAARHSADLIPTPLPPHTGVQGDVGKSEGFGGASEKTAVDRVNNWLSTDLPTTEESAVQTLDRILPTLHSIELEIDVALGIWIECNVDHMTVLLFAFGTDIILELFDPGFALLPIRKLAIRKYATELQRLTRQD
jgi:hypothetical protein